MEPKSILPSESIPPASLPSSNDERKGESSAVPDIGRTQNGWRKS